MKPIHMHQVYMGTIGDMKNLEIHFGQMAEQGCMIERIGVFSHRFRAIEPCKKRFFVDFLPQITAFDYPENEDAQEYRRICEESGWSFVAANKQFHVFYADENAPELTPIHTDNKIQAQIYLKMCRKYELFSLILPMLVLCAILFPQLSYNGMEIFLSNLLIFQIAGWFFFLVGYAWTLGFVLLWYRRVKKSAKDGLPMPAVDYRLSQIRRRVFAAGVFAFFLCLLIGIVLEILGGMPKGFILIFVIPFSSVGVGLWIRRQIDTKRRGRKTNIIMTVAVIAVFTIILIGALNYTVLRSFPNHYMSSSLGDRPALTLNCVGISSAPENTSFRESVSVLVPIHYVYWEINRQGNVHSEAYRPVSSLIARGLYERYARGLEDGYSGYRDRLGYDVDLVYLAHAEAAYWGADEGVAAFDTISDTTELLLLNGRTILRLSIYGKDIGIDAIVQAVRGLMANYD